MDPLTAVSLAGTVIQFVSFASDVISKSKKIYDSAEGSDGDVLNLESTHGKLQDLAIALESGAIGSGPCPVEIRSNTKAIQDLSRSCRSDCDKLMNIVSKLKAGNGPHHQKWQSFKLALKTVWKRQEMSELDERLRRTQGTLTLEICVILRPWTLPELYEMLQKAARRNTLPVKLCFFIDGLDEYEGDHLDLCRAIQDLAKSTHIKLCVSSRAWNVFEDSFGRAHESKLYLHELTRADIQRYTEERLKGHPRWKDLEVESRETDLLLHDIANKAEGVFLWVFLVTKLLREGMNDYDSFSELRRRVDSFPTDLETFFKHILGSIDPCQYNKMATSLQIAVAACEPLHISIYTFHDQEHEDDQYLQHLVPIEEVVEEKTNRQTIRRLNGRCRGLLETNFNGYVTFLHRTVMDFLRLSEMSQFLKEKSPVFFNANLTLLKAQTARIVYLKSFPEDVFDEKKEATMSYAKKLDSDCSEDNPASRYLLDQLESVLHILRPPHILIFRALLVNFMTKKHMAREYYFETCSEPPLIHNALHGFSMNSQGKQTSLKAIQLLFDCGQSPNQIYEGTKNLAQGTPWSILTTTTLFLNRGLSWGDDMIFWLDLVAIFLDNGANPKAPPAMSIEEMRPVGTFTPSLQLTTWDYFLWHSLNMRHKKAVQEKYLQLLDKYLEKLAQMDLIETSHLSRGSEKTTFSFLQILRRFLSHQNNDDFLNIIIYKVAEARLPADLPSVIWSLMECWFRKEDCDYLMNQYYGSQTRPSSIELLDGDKSPDSVISGSTGKRARTESEHCDLDSSAKSEEKHEDDISERFAKRLRPWEL